MCDSLLPTFVVVAIHFDCMRGTRTELCVKRRKMPSCRGAMANPYTMLTTINYFHSLQFISFAIRSCSFAVFVVGVIIIGLISATMHRGTEAVSGARKNSPHDISSRLSTEHVKWKRKWWWACGNSTTKQ